MKCSLWGNIKDHSSTRFKENSDYMDDMIVL